MASMDTGCQLVVLLLLVQTFNVAKGLTRISVMEDAAVGRTLSPSLQAPLSGFSYVLFDGGDRKAGELFHVSSDGKITVKKKLNYVNGGKNIYDLVAVKRKVGSTIDGVPEIARITIKDVNDHDPIFKKTTYEGYISESAVVGSSVLGLKDCFATDQDSSSISRYEIVDGNKDNIFIAKVKDVPKNNAIPPLKLLVIETTRTIDREALGATPFINLKVQAVDGGNPSRRSSQITVRIKVHDQNDNDPVFEMTDWRVTIQENVAVMTSVLKLVATDNDEGSNKQLYYYFPDVQNKFIIDPYTGVISVAAPLSHSTKSSYKMKVIVKDRAVEGPRNNTCTVHISLVKVVGYPTASAVNTAPRFSPPTYDIKVRGDLPIRAFVLLPRAMDSDGTGNNNGKLTFSMNSKSGTIPFDINPTSGAITVAKKLTPSKDPIEFTVTAQDGGFSTATASVKILVKAISKNKGPPKFTESTINTVLADDAIPTTVVFTAEAKDDDTVKYSLVGGTGLGRFKINEQTGIVTPKVLFRSFGTYDLYIEAKDQNPFELSSIMYARINIIGNSANPIFSHAMYEASVSEQEPAGVFVTSVYASFPDKTKTVRYSLTGDSAGFQIDPVSGVVTTEHSLDYELNHEKRLAVKASVGSPAKSAQAILNVVIKNKNDEKPFFSRPSIVLTVPENLGYIPSLVCLFADDADGPEDLVYSIKSGNTDNLFRIDPKTGIYISMLLFCSLFSLIPSSVR